MENNLVPNYGSCECGTVREIALRPWYSPQRFRVTLSASEPVYARTVRLKRTAQVGANEAASA
jgi:hypothetical protein